MTRLWIDDERQPPNVMWDWRTTSDGAIKMLQDSHVRMVSFDHDLGGDDTTRPVVLWMCVQDVWPKYIFVHTMNPIGADWLTGMCKRYAPDSTEVRRIPFNQCKPGWGYEAWP